jgi:GH15 family glucan-1,4-alpha-glucosidase
MRIEDYALLGDTQTIALVGRDGSVDWLCFPRFDSGACFAALLGTPEHGRWRIAPRGELRRVDRRYRDSTMILETTMDCDDGSVRLVDALILADRRDEARALFEQLLAVRNDVGLLSEEYDTRHRRLVGNFPQAFSHVALINSAGNLSAERGPARQRSERHI